jgi:LuxR family maltose regulon positive regulatory protein
LKASAWFASEGLIDEAVKHALRSGNMAHAKEQIVQHWATMAHQGKVLTVLRWLDDLPADLSQRDLGVALARCWALHLSGQTPAITTCLNAAETLFDQMVAADLFPAPQQAVIAAQLAMMQSVLARANGDHGAAVDHAESAVDVVPQHVYHASGPAWNLLGAARAGTGDLDGAIAAFEHGIDLAYSGNNLLSAFVSTFGQAMYLMQQGQLNKALENCHTALAHVTRDGQADFPATGLLHIALARLALERWALDEAETHLTTGLQLTRPGGFSEAVRFGRYTRAQLAVARGDYEQTRALFEETEPVILAMDDPYLTGELNREWAIVCLQSDDLNSARQRLTILAEKSNITQHPQLQIPYAWMTIRLLNNEARYDNALAALDVLIHDLRAVHSYGELIRGLALQAVALAGTNNRSAAYDALWEAVELGGEQNYVRRWLDAGPAIIPLVKHLRDEAGAAHAAYLDHIIAAGEIAFGVTPSPANDDLLSPLSDRELDVLRLIDEGYSNQAIAEELVVTLHTVKKHTSNIYSKLGVTSRTQAVARARELNLI